MELVLCPLLVTIKCFICCVYSMYFYAQVIIIDNLLSAYYVIGNMLNSLSGFEIAHYSF